MLRPMRAMLLLFVLCVSPCRSTTQTNWAGISAYYMCGCNSTVRIEALNAMRAAGLKVLRVFLLSTEGEGAVPACDSSPVPDVEPKIVGVFNDTILARLDDLLFEASIRGLKVTVALHDRYSLGCWRSDSYQRKYNLTKTDCSTDPNRNDPTKFYTEGREDFKRRIAHVLSYVSRHTGKALGQWDQALFSVEAENEAFGHAQVTLETIALCLKQFLYVSLLNTLDLKVRLHSVVSRKRKRVQTTFSQKQDCCFSVGPLYAASLTKSPLPNIPHGIHTSK